MSPASRRPSERGASLLFALALVLALAVVAAALIKIAGNDRIAAAKMSVQERGLACADAGIQYGRRYFGCNYKRTSNWNGILSGVNPGRYEPGEGASGDPNYRPALDAYPSAVASIPLELMGDSGSSGALDSGTDLDGSGQPSFWVSIRDDDDERPLGAADDRTRDNNLAVWLRSECIKPGWAAEEGGARRTSVIEVLLVYLPDASSPYGKASSASNFPESSLSGPAVVTTTSSCD